MVPNRSIAGVLALGSLLLAATGEGLVLSNTAGAAGLVLLGYAPLAAAAAWLALGAPRTRGDIRV